MYLLPPWQGGYVFGSIGLFVYLSVRLTVCFPVSNTTQHVMNGLQWKSIEWFRVAKGTSD